MRLFGISFDGRSGSLIGVELALGVAVVVGNALVGVAVGNAWVGVAVGGGVVEATGVRGTPLTLSTVTVMAGFAIRLLDESKPITDSVCIPSPTEVESH